ncbi:MAG: hypothetical protein HZB91_00010 [Elusimicrobia bacterium]|nr:hypothetical protein [Elusimicrobiota bacterium]
MTEIRIGIALANPSGQKMAAEVDQHFKNSTHGQIRPVFDGPSDGIRGAAFDYWGILSKTADLIEVGLALYGAYKIIAQQKADSGASRTDIYVVAPFPDHKTEIWVGKTGMSQEEFLREFQVRIQPLLDGPKPLSKRSQRPSKKRTSVPRKRRQ